MPAVLPPWGPPGLAAAHGLALRAAAHGLALRAAAGAHGGSHLASAGRQTLTRAIEVAAAIVAALLASRLGSRVAKRLARPIRARAAARGGSPRAERRIDTVVSLATSLWRGLVWVVAVLVVLGSFGIDLTPVLAGATVVGAALGFGAQSLVRDYLSGFLIIVEDQYGIGDTITVGTTTGVVEDLTLRVTRLRASDGRVFYIANGEIRQVANASIQWTRTLVDVVVPLGADLARVTAAVEEEAARFGAEPANAAKLLEPPEVWGAAAADAAGVTVRVALKAPPGEQDGLARDLRARLMARLQRDGLLGTS
jgi:small-conductance mechanosensitive channel